MTQADFRRRMRQVWFVMAVVVACQGVAIAAVSLALFSQHDRVLDATEQVQRNQRSGVNATIVSCQRGNELRRAVGLVAREQARDRTSRGLGTAPTLDPDAFTRTSCRRTAIDVHGVDPGAVPDYVP